MAFHELADTLKDNRYRNYVKENYHFFFQNLPTFHKLFEKRVPGAPGHQFFRMERLDDFGDMASGLFELFDKDHDPEYRQYLEKCMDYIQNDQNRLDCLVLK